MPDVITLIYILLLLGVASVMLVGWYCHRKKLFIWLPDYVASSLREKEKSGASSNEPVDIMLVMVDHFELAGKKDRLDAWMTRYPEIAGAHRDADGISPRHSWFYALDLIHEHEIQSIGQLVDAGLGEIELHWHHDHDDAESFVSKLRSGMSVFQRYGHMLPYRDDQAASFAFIHGNWSLDNSRGAEFCGVDNEVDLLVEEGCYADFTYPALFNDGQPSLANCIHYAIDDGKPKSYDRGGRAHVGHLPRERELMLVQGPLLINWRDWRFGWHPTIEDGDINASATHYDPVRIDSWVNRNIHVEGQPNWIFVKVFCHGAQDHLSVLGSATDRMFSHLENKYNDGGRYRLHYVSAREAFNIIRAAEDGKTGDAGKYRDYVVPSVAERRTMQVERRGNRANRSEKQA